MEMEGKNQNPDDKAGPDGSTQANKGDEAYDASRDPRTGRPPNPLEAQRLAREREQERQASGQERDESADISIEQAPARMTSPSESGDEKSAVDALVEEGIAREEAERLVEAHGSNWETLKAVAWTKRAPDSGTR